MFYKIINNTSKPSNTAYFTIKISLNYSYCGYFIFFPKIKAKVVINFVNDKIELQTKITIIMKQNKISAVLDPAIKADIINLINDIKSKLPFAVNLTPTERRKLRKMGPKSVDYVNQCYASVSNFPNVFPGTFNASNFDEDMKLIAALEDVNQQLQSLYESINDTVMTAKSDAMKQADEVYKYLKQAADGDVAVSELVKNIGKRFDRKSNAPANDAGNV